MAVLRSIHEVGGLSGRRMVADFIQLLWAYDPRGIACSDILKEAFYDPGSDDMFIRDISSGWLEWTFGTNGNDTISAGDEGSLIVGGKGDDKLAGGVGDNIYFYNLGDGNDVITESGTDAGRCNMIKFGEGIGADDIEFITTKHDNHSYSDLVIRIKSTGETITITRGLSSAYASIRNSYSIQAVEFADGTLWTYEDIMKRPILSDERDKNLFADAGGSILIGNALDNYMAGNAGADALHGGEGYDDLRSNAGDDILVGGKGDDSLTGGEGDDVYVYNLGDGNDIINESENRADRRNVIKFGEGIGADDIEFIATNHDNYSYSDLVIRIKTTGETITIARGLSSAYASDRNPFSIQALEFADGTVLTYEDIMKRPMLSHDRDKNIFAEVGGSILVGNALGNYMAGSANSDTLHGGEGSDDLRGNDGDDILWGGADDDRLEGGAGDDAYLFGRGDGNDVVHESWGDASRRNEIRLGEGIGADDVELLLGQSASSGSMNLIIRIRDTGETLTINNAVCTHLTNAANGYSIQAIRFADGTAWEWSDILARRATMDTATAAAYADVAGSFIAGNAGDNDIRGSANNAGSDVFHGADGNDALWGMGGDDVLHGDGGDDSLYGDAGNDTLWGGAGHDRMEGGVGNDIYLFGRGDGNDVVYDVEGNASKRNEIHLGEGIGADDIEFLLKQSSTGGYMDLIIRIKDTGETLTISNAICGHTANASNSYSIQALKFADGMVWE